MARPLWLLTSPRSTTRPCSGRSPGDHRTITRRSSPRFKARIETLEAELARIEVAAAGHRADFERERERCDGLMAEVLKSTAELMAAREGAARLAGEIAAIHGRPWWRRLAGLREFRPVGHMPALPTGLARHP
jgi:hypothetical protein